jgi:hypothetical protein
MSLAAGLAVLVAVAWSSVGVAWAHEVGLSRGVYTLTGREVAAELTFARAELLGLAPTLDGDGDGVLTDAELSSGTAALQRVVDGVQLTGDGQACASAWVDAALTEEDGARVRLRFTCPAEPGRITLGLPLLDSLRFGHRHLGHLARAEGEVFADLVLHRRAASASADVPAGSVPSAPPPPPVGDYFQIGVEHILIGTDHLVFLLGSGGDRRPAALADRGGHRLHGRSLAEPRAGDPRGVAAGSRASSSRRSRCRSRTSGSRTSWSTDAAGRWRITLPFGFIHGFGFAGVLAEVGVPDAAVGLALLLFNLGVEAGPAAGARGGVAAAGCGSARGEAYVRGSAGSRWISAAIVVAGLYWFIERVAFA